MKVLLALSVLGAAMGANYGIVESGGGSATFEPPVHGRIVGATCTISFDVGIATCTHIGVGHYQVDLSAPISENEMATIVMPESAAPRIFGVSYIDDDSIELRSWDEAGIAAEMNFRITVIEAPL
jgi:hypothetical protein